MKRCAGGLLIQGDRVLLGKRAAHRDLYPGVWDIVGGHCLPDEDPDQALVRELEEEIGVTPTAFAKLAVLHEPQAHIYGEREYHVYAVTAWSGPLPTALEEEHSEVRWLSIDEALRLDLAHPGYVDLLASLGVNPAPIECSQHK